MTHPTKDWEFDDTIEEAFQEWFNGEYGNFTFRSEWFFGDCEVGDVNTRKDLMYKWVHASFISGWEAATKIIEEEYHKDTLQTGTRALEIRCPLLYNDFIDKNSNDF